MKGAKHPGVGKFGNDGFVLCDIEIGVATVSGIDEDAKEGRSNFGKEALHDGHQFFKRGEICKFAGAKEFDVPVFDTGTCESGFLVGAVVEFDVLGDTGLEFFIVGGRSAFHPGFHRG